jgi:hypothetical protein
MKGDRAVGLLVPDTLGDERVEVKVGVDERPRPLHRRHRAGLAVGDAALPCAATVERRHDPDEHAQHLGDQRLVAEQADPQPPRKRQRPLPVVDVVRQDVVHQVRGPARHASALARRAQASDFATERHEHLIPTRGALDPGEASLDDTTVEEPPEALFDVARQPVAVRRAIARVLQHGLEVVGDHPIERGRLRSSRPIALRQRCRGRARAAFVDVRRRARSKHARRGAGAMPAWPSSIPRGDLRCCRCDVRDADTGRPHTGRHGDAGDQLAIGGVHDEPDFNDILSEFIAANVEFMVVGAFAVAAHLTHAPQGTSSSGFDRLETCQSSRRGFGAKLRAMWVGGVGQ